MSKLFSIFLIFLINFTVGHPVNAMHGDDGEITAVTYTKVIMRDESVAREKLYNDLTADHPLNWNQVIAETKQDPYYIERGYGKRTRHGNCKHCNYCGSNTHDTYAPWCGNCRAHHNADPWCSHCRTHAHASDPWCITCKVHHTDVEHDLLVKAALKKIVPPDDKNPPTTMPEGISSLPSISSFSDLSSNPDVDTELKFEDDL